ncbi:MAG: COP23 domain-containing protein [Microcystaceae cyanobacterium]
MLSKFYGTSAGILGLLGTFFAVSPSTYAQSLNFLCQADGSGIPTTYAETPDGYIPVFKWTSTYFQRSYTPERRCQEVSDRMNRFAASNSLDYLTSGRVNRQPVICAGTNCSSSNVLVTLKPGQNPSQVLQEIEANRSGAGGPSFQLAGSSSSSNSSSLSRNADGTVTLNLNRYLESAAPETADNANSDQDSPFKPSPGMVKPDYEDPTAPRIW